MTNPPIVPAHVFEQMEKSVSHRSRRDMSDPCAYVIAEKKGQHARCDCGAVDYERGTGRTTRQMQGATHGAIFITKECDYAKHLAHKIGRPDLQIKPPSVMDDGWLHGRDLSGIVVDHHVQMSGYQYERLVAALHYVRAPA